MHIESLRLYCLKKLAVTEDFPFDEQTLVFRVMNKIFLLVNIIGDPLKVNLKCDPLRAIDLRETHEDITPGFHMNKKHWNTVDFGGSLSAKELKELINHSYDMVVKGLPKKDRLALAPSHEN